ncbi:MAG: RNA-binding protein [Desulfurococcales archaeon ex4484_42]|nr:MAG: RNA-binding protein [Desulfurococcales archaeon ex4484_42]
MSDAAQRLLSENVGSLVLVKLRGNRLLRGKLRSFDQHLNIVLDDADEILEDGSVKKLGTVIIRGENVILVSPAGR